MLYRSLYTLNILHVRLRVILGTAQIKKLPLELFSVNFTSTCKRLSISQRLKLPDKAQATEVISDSREESSSGKHESKTSATETNDLSSKLVQWVMQNNISHVTFSRLLKILNEHGLKNLPKNSKALLQAKEDEISVHEIPPGVYYHFSLEKNLKVLIEHLVKKNNLGPVINISIFVDELLLSATNKDSLWVILGSIVDFNKIVFGVGAYRGSSKPEDSNLFLSNFVKEVNELCSKGLVVNQKNYKIAIKRVICDAPAKAFILNIQSHTGYSSCTKCWAVGEHINKICFPDQSHPKTDKDYEKSAMYKSKKTELLKIPNFGIVSNVPLDYMHLVCFGIVRKLLTNVLNKLCVKTVSEKIQKLQKLYEFQSKPKSLAVLSAWTATEFRQFLLYYGPVVLHGMLDEKYYDNFLHLHVGCRLMCLDHTTETAQLGRTLLQTFIEQYKKLYGVEEMSHNVHGLYHLVDDYLNHGTLDNFSSFLFEKFLFKLKRSMKKSKKKTLPQLILKESYSKVFNRSLVELTKNKCRLFKEEKVKEGYSKYTHLYLSGTRISPLSGDNYVLLKNNKIIKVVEIFKKEKSVFVSGKEFSSVCNFYKKPLESMRLKIFEVGDLSNSEQTWSVFMIDKKCVKVPIGKGRSAMIALLNESGGKF